MNAGSFAASGSPSPGELISIFGTNLSDVTDAASTLPLQTRMDGVAVILSGQPLPLVAISPNQINAVVPYQVRTGSSYQLFVSKNNQIALPVTIPIRPAEPAVFSTDASGKGQGHVYVIGSDGSQTLADPSQPAKPGDAVVIYCSGLGQVNPAVEDGAATPGDVLHPSTLPASVTIGGQPAQVFFAGLTPGLTGLYQINAIVPAGVTPDSNATVVASVGGFGGPPVSMAVAAAQ